MNCSGKHAAMLATCVRQRLGHRDLPRARPPAAAGDRRDVRRADRRAGRRGRRRRLRGAAAVRVADRAGPRLPPARSARRRRPAGPELGRVADAIRAHPEYVSGTTRDELRPAHRDPRCDRQGRRGVLLRRGAARRPRVRAQDRRRRAAGAAGADGRGAAAQRRGRRARRRRRGRAAHRRGRRCSAAASRWARSAPASERC